MESGSRGDPESLLRWTSKSVRHLAAGLREQGHSVHFTTVAKLLGLLGYSLQANVKTREGASHLDRDTQFEHINAVATAAVASGVPLISVDTKKKELVGDFKNGGREWRRKGEPELVRVHDFKDKQLGKAIPYGVYDIAANQGWVNVGIDHDTAQFAVNSIRSWWQHLGRPRYPNATRLHDHRRLRWLKRQPRASVEGRAATVGRRNRSRDRRLPSSARHQQVEPDRAPPLQRTSRSTGAASRSYSLETVINLIASTTTNTGLKVYARLDNGSYPDKIRVPDEQIAAVNLHGDTFHPEWNYTIKPHAH